MRFALSTNWCNQRMESGEEIAETAGELGFDELELGFRTTAEQIDGFKSRLDVMPVGSVHAFCPVPVSAPYGHPELYSLAAAEANERALARVHVSNTIRFAAEMGASSVVLHAGRVGFSGFFRRLDSGCLHRILNDCAGEVSAKRYASALAVARRRRTARALRRMDVLCGEIDALLPLLKSCNVTLALENLPYLEGFPDEEETASLLERFDGAPVKAWFDTGHDRVRRMHAWRDAETALDLRADAFAGMHINDVADFRDDHLPPGEGAVDFSALKPLAEKVRHIVFEPAAEVTELKLASSLSYLRRLWAESAVAV